MSESRLNASSYRKKNAKKGLSFTVMVVGASGLGKSTFVNTLCESAVMPKRAIPPPETAGQPKTVTIEPITAELEEDGQLLQLNIIDTPGYGDNINNEDGFEEILKYIERQYDEILAEESRIKRNPKFNDSRVHALLYFISPNGKSLKNIDIEFMKKLGPRVNIIPVIAKADTLCPSELSALKANVMRDIKAHNIPIFDFPVDEQEDDEEYVEENNELRSLLPFAVVGSETELVVNRRRVRCRQYPWGIVEVDNAKHCDFSKLRYMLLSSHVMTLKELTQDELYEKYRTEVLSREGHVDPNDDNVQYIIVPAGTAGAKAGISAAGNLN